MLTLKELKKIVKVADVKMRIPTTKALGNEEIVVKEIVSAECDITVYKNGYVLYREGTKTTVFPLHTCKGYEYMDAKGARNVMEAEFFDNENWYVRLLIEASDRMELNQSKINSNHKIFSYSDLIDDRTILIDQSQEFIDQFIEEEVLIELMECLTMRQKEVVQLFYFEQLSQKDIANYIGIRQQSVCETLQRAISVMKKHADVKK